MAPQSPEGLTADAQMFRHGLGLEPGIRTSVRHGIASGSGGYPRRRKLQTPPATRPWPDRPTPDSAAKGKAGEDAEALGDGGIDAAAGPFAEHQGRINR